MLIETNKKHDVYSLMACCSLFRAGLLCESKSKYMAITVKQKYNQSRDNKVMSKSTHSPLRPCNTYVGRGSKWDPQGSVLGPLLFLVLIGDIDKNVTTSFISSFADDTLATKGIMTLEDTQALQTDLDSIYGWAEQNNIMFNFEMFECLRYSRNSEIKTSTGNRTMSGD